MSPSIGLLLTPYSFAPYRRVCTGVASRPVVRDLAIDLGTANTLVWARGRGIVLNEPTVVAVHQRDGQVQAMGHKAYTLIAQSSGQFIAYRPMADGTVTDFHATARLLELLFQRLGVTRFSRSRVLICVPSGATEVERRALEEAVIQAGVGTTYLMEEPLAAAIGAGLPIAEPAGLMLLDVGGGSCQVAMISLGGIVTTNPIRMGGFAMDDAIAQHIRVRYDLAVGERTAEEVKFAIGSAYPLSEEPWAEVRGRKLATGLPETIALSAEEVRIAIDPCVSAIVDAVVDTLGNCPPELVQDVLDFGLWMVGGGALLRGLDVRITAEAEIPVRVAERPLEAVIRGAGQAVESFEVLRHLMTRT
jgi:rod shape-determining protein MreB